MADYMFGSARVRVLETALIGKERLEALLTCKSSVELWERLREYGIEPETDSNGAILREETLLRILKKAYGDVLEMLPEADLLRLWLYPYDCNNLKAAIKGFARGIDPASMMFDFGTVAVEDVVEMAKKGSFHSLPAAMQKAAEDAVAAYAKTSNPQWIDLLIDRACYADMLEAAQKSGERFALALVREKIDLSNILTCVRILRMKSGEAGKVLLHDALIEGGFLATSDLTEWFESGEDELWNRLYYREYSSLSSAVSASDKSLTAVERCCDNAWMEKIREVKFVPYGAEVLIAFLLAHEYEVRNLRIVIAGKDAGLDNATLRERIRESYV